MVDLLGILRRGIKKPPNVIVRRLFAEFQAETERFLSPLRARRCNEKTLIKKTNHTSFEQLWADLGKREYVAVSTPVDAGRYDSICSGDGARILKLASNALRHQVNLLGSGDVALGEKIDWHKDYKSGKCWAPAYFRSISYNNPELPSDVKFPWEVSRLQWLIPAGQAYLLTGDEKYAEAVRNVIDDWIDNNPYAHSVNWACTMEVALRILSFTWFFHVFHKSQAWADSAFRLKFLCALYLHGDFTQRHLERSDINGNHYTADAAGLVFAGLFWGEGGEPGRWLQLGWQILCHELPRQVFPDGVDFEASVPYHRLVLELFLLPAIYREKHGLAVPESYKERVVAMTVFTATYSRRDGSVPLWGDADDARALPFGAQGINDHRYILGLVGSVWAVPSLIRFFSGSRSEIFWLLGEAAAAELPPLDAAGDFPSSRSFPDGGFYVMRNAADHVFVDCGPIGLAGRGGHGHNDCLSFEAALDGVQLISDCGAYLYTASYEERNNFRSTAYHNTPQIGTEEINRFIRWDYLWNMHYDALPVLQSWQPGDEFDLLRGAHSGYRRVKPPLTPVRTLVLDHSMHSLVVRDEFEGDGLYQIGIPLHLAPGVLVTPIEDGYLKLLAEGKEYRLIWADADKWTLEIGAGRVSPSYGIAVPITRLCWHRTGQQDCPLTVCISPERYATAENVHELFHRIESKGRVGNRC